MSLIPARAPIHWPDSGQARDEGRLFHNKHAQGRLQIAYHASSSAPVNLGIDYMRMNTDTRGASLETPNRPS